MVNAAPTPVDVVDFQFKLRYRLKVFQNEENDPFAGTCSLIATASRFGLLFVGTSSPCFQVLQLQSLEKYTTKNGDVTDYNRRTIPLPSLPKHLSVNCDCTKFCVTFEKDNCAKALIYDITSFLKQNASIIQEIQLTPTLGVEVTETCWNPAISSIFSVCKSDGSLGVYELKETGIEIAELPATAGAICMCWSPKGKQIAVGSSDGKITQFKPDLKAVKVISAPVLEGSQSVVAMQWVSNYQFIVVYKSSNPDVQLNLVVVDCPKLGDTVYTNYEDICYSYGNTRPHQFYLQLQPIWNILMVASSNSMEVGVLAFEKDRWTQWILADSARAELPLSFTKQETLPVGMAFDTSSTQPYPWGETTLHPMPLMFLLSHHGTLCCFNAINVKKDAGSICCAPEQLTDVNGLSQFTSPTAMTPSKPTAIDLARQTVQQPAAVSQQTFSLNQPAIQIEAKTIVNTQTSISHPQSQLIFSAKPALSSFSLVNTTTTTTTPAKADPQPLFNLNLKSIEQAENLVKQQQKSPFAKPPANDLKPNVITPIAPQKLNQIQPAEVTVLNEDTEALIAQMVKEECAMLEMELMVLLQQGYELKVDVGNENEFSNLMQNTNSLVDFMNEVTETSSSQAVEVHSLKQSLLQTWVWYEEARSRFITFKDPKLIALMHAQPLDPASERQLADILHLFYYIESQLNQANVALDEQWESFQDSCKKKLHLRMPSIETIYQSMVKQNATLQKQTYILKDLSNRVRHKNRDYQIPHLLVSLENVDSLEEQLKNLHFQPSNVFHLQYERVLKRQKFLTKPKSDKLTTLLLNRKVVHVSVSKPQMLNASLQLNSLIGEQPFSPIAPNKKLQPQKLDFMQSTPKAFTKPEPKTLQTISTVSSVSTAPPEAETKSPIFSLGKPIQVSKSASSAFFPTAQTVSFGTKSSGSNLFSSNTATNVKQHPTITTAAEQQKFFFSFNTPTTTAVATSTSAKTTASTNSTNVFTAPVSSSSTDGLKAFFFKRMAASTSSPFSFQTLATDTTTKTSSSFTGFNFSANRNSLLKVPIPAAASANLTKTNSAPSFGSQTTEAELSVSETSSSTVKAIAPVSSPTTAVANVRPTPGIKPSLSDSHVAFAALSSAPSVFASKNYTTMPVTTSSSMPPDVKETSAAITPLINTAVEVVPPSSSSSSSPLTTETTAVPSKTSVFNLGGEVSVIPIATSSSVGPILSKLTTQASSIFGGGGGITSTTKSSISGNGSALFSSPTTSASIFGKATATATTSTSSNFGSNNQVSIFATPTTTTVTTTAASGTIFGNLSKPILGGSTTSAFSTPKTSFFGASTPTTTNIFGAPVTSAVPNIFGTSTTASSNIFGGGSTTSSITTASSVFGISTATTGFETSTMTTTPSIFGSASPSVFETPAAPAFGTTIFGAPAISSVSNTATTTAVFGTPTATVTPVGIFGTPATTAGVFGTPTTSSVFSATTAPSVFGTQTSTTTSSAFNVTTAMATSVFGTPTSAPAAFGTPITGATAGSVFGTPTTSTAFSASTAPSVFGTPTTTSPAFSTSASIFGGTPTTSSIFGGSTTSSSIFGSAPNTSSVFGTSSNTFGAPTPANFGGFKPTTTTSVFGQSPPAFSSGSIFSTPASSTSSGSIFGNTAASSNVFGTPTSSAPFGTFGTPTTGTSPFGPSQRNSFSFAANTPANSSSGFGFNKPSFGFGSIPSNTEPGSFNFGSLNVCSPTTTTSSFGSGFGQAQNPFGRTSNEEQKSPFGGGNPFGATPVTSSVFGGSSPFNKSTTAFGGPAAFGGSSQSFLQQPAFGQATFGSGSVFGGTQPGPFSGGTQSVSQTGFGSSAAFTKPSSFGSSPAFGSPASAGGFGAPPAFGGSPTFGSTGVFGGTGKVFGGSPPTVDTFASAGQQNATFANLANQPTLGFGSLAQQSQTPTTQTTGFSGGSSFSTWR